MENYNTAPEHELEVKTEDVEYGIGVDAEAAAAVQPRPDLSGLRIKSPAHPTIYLIDPEGFRRQIPDPATYNNLFRSRGGVVVDINVNDIAQASPITNGAVLIRAVNTSPIYIVSNGMKRWIGSPAAMDKYHFAWGRVVTVPQITADSIRSGFVWN